MVYGIWYLVYGMWYMAWHGMKWQVVNWSTITMALKFAALIYKTNNLSAE